MVLQIVSPLKTNRMAAAGKVITMADEVIVNKIYLVRGQKVMIDRDLAELYGVETKVLKQAVRRNGYSALRLFTGLTIAAFIA
jgi:hypothetical protein